MRRTTLLAALLALALAGCAGRPRPDYDAISRHLDETRAAITPPLGATVYALDRRRLLDQPQGDNQPLGEALAQLPGVVPGPDGGVSVRGR